MSTTSKAPGAAFAGEVFVIPGPLFEDINGASTWNYAVSRLSQLLKLPDITTRHGLKKVHVRFDEISHKLDSIYKSAERKNNEKIMGGVVGITAKLCADAILRDKLFKQGILKKILPLLDRDLTRHLALNALAMVTHHGGLDARQEIARHNKVLVDLIRAHPEDDLVAELAVMTIDHATIAVIDLEEPPMPSDLKEISIRLTLEAVLNTLRKPSIPVKHLVHAFGLLVTATQRCSKQCRAIPGYLPFLAAFTRSKNINVRAKAVGSLLRLTVSESFPDGVIPVQALMSRISNLPSTPQHLDAVAANYGLERMDLNVTAECMATYTRAIAAAAQDHDMCALGVKLADVIQRCESAVYEGWFQDETGRVRDVPGSPFQRYTDSFPLAVKALRARGSPSDLDAADVVQLKYFIVRYMAPQAIAHGHAAIKRNPRLAYAYYAISNSADIDEVLRAVKKGLKCPDVAPFVRNQLLWRATYHASEKGLRILQESMENDERARAEGTVFMMSAWEDVKTFVSEAPPDSRHMLAMISWYMLLTIMIRGPELSEDLKELDAARRKLKTSTEFLSLYGYPPNRLQVNLTRDVLLENYREGAREWSFVVEQYDELDGNTGPPPRRPSVQADDSLAAWLGNMDIHDHDHDHVHPFDNDGEGAAHACTCHGQTSHAPSADVPSDSETQGYELYRCSWCGNPSAVLRRCGGCGKARYCDGVCQKSHWKEHKADCKGR